MSYVFKPGDQVLWMKELPRKPYYKEVPATFVRYAGSLVCIQPEREAPDDILPSKVRVKKERLKVVK